MLGRAALAVMQADSMPLQSIGLVAGALVAVVYWAAVIVGRWIEL